MVQILRSFLVIILFSAAAIAQVLTVPNGGTGQNTLTPNGPLIGNGTSPITAIGAGTAGQCLVSGGPSAPPVFAACPGGGGGSMVYPASGVANSTGTAWGPSFSATNPIPANYISTLNQSTTGNAATATALAATPTQCPAGNFAIGITANGSANCATNSMSWSSLLAPTANLSLPMVHNTTLFNVDFATQTGGANAFAISEVGTSAPANSVLLSLYSKNISMSPLVAETTSGTGGFTVNGQLGDLQMVGTSKLVGPVRMPGLLSAAALATDANGNIIAGTGANSPQVIQATGNTPLTITSPDGNTTLGVVMANGTNPTLNSSTGILGIQTLSVGNLTGTGNACMQADATGAVTRTSYACNTTPFNSLLAATANNIISNTSFQQNWEWSFTGTTAQSGLAISESPVSPSTATTNNLLSLQTAVGSTVRPFAAFVHGSGVGFYVSSAGDITASSTATFIGPHRLPALLSAATLGTDAFGNIIVGTGAAQVYPATGIANSTGTAWGTSYSATSPIPASFITNPLNQSTTGNAATATALAATPTQCTSGQFATGITASGNANCSIPSGTGGAGPTFPVTVISANYTVTGADFASCAIKVISGNGSYTFTLLNPAPTNGQCLRIQNQGSGQQTVSPNGLTINGNSASFSILPAPNTNNANEMYIVSDGTNYVVMRNYAVAFQNLLGGTSTSAALNVGNASVLQPTGTGVVSANQVNGAIVPVSAVSLATNASGQIVAGTGGAPAFSAITSGTNAAATMTVGTGASIVTSGSGTVSANQVNGTALPVSAATLATNASGQIVAGTGSAPAFSSITSGTNTTASMTVGSGAFIGTTGTGSISANQINGTTVPVSAAYVGTNSSGQLVAEAAPAAITSINNNSNAAQTIQAGTAINVVSSGGTTTINATGVPRTCTDGGTAGAVALTCTPSTSGFGAYVKGETFTFFPAVNSTGTATISIDGRSSGVSLTSLPSPYPATNPNLSVNYMLTATYDGTRFSVGCPVQTNPTGAGTNNQMVLALGTVGASGNCPAAAGWVATNFALGALNGAIATTIGSGGTAMNATVQPVTFGPASVSGGGGAFLGGNVLVKGGDNNNTGATETSGSIEIRPGNLGNFPTTTNANMGGADYEVGGLATAAFNQGQAACITASSSGAGFAGRYSPCAAANITAWVGVFSQATAASATGTFVQVQGDAPFYSSATATWTAGNYICLDTADVGAFTSSSTACATAGNQAGIVSFTDASAVSVHWGVIARR